MLLYLIKRLGLLIFTLLMLCLVSFLLAYLFPGDPLVNLSGMPSLGPDAYSLILEKYKGTEGWFAQFWQYMYLLAEGDWGLSLSSGLPVFDEVIRLIPASLELSLYALLLSLIVGLPLGFLSGLNQHKATDNSILAASLLGYSIPIFWLSLLLIALFALQLGWFPMSGRISLLQDIPSWSGFLFIDIAHADIINKSSAYLDAFRHLVLPTLCISIVTTSLVIRITRRSVINVISADYIKAAYTKGLSGPQVIWRHGVRNALVPIMPQLAMQLTTLITNAMIVEVIFSWPGIGHWLIQAIYQRDFPAIRAGMLAVSALVVIVTLSLDMLLRISNPLKDRESHGTI